MVNTNEHQDDLVRCRRCRRPATTWTGSSGARTASPWNVAFVLGARLGTKLVFGIARVRNAPGVLEGAVGHDAP